MRSPGSVSSPATSADNERLSFAWDRVETAASLRHKLQCATPDEWIQLAAWILREAQPREVWQFLRPQEVARHLDELTPVLGRKKDFWTYLIQTWRELGKL